MACGCVSPPQSRPLVEVQWVSVEIAVRAIERIQVDNDSLQLGCGIIIGFCQYGIQPERVSSGIWVYPRTQNLEHRIQNLEPITCNLEPSTQNLEPRTQNVEPRTQNPAHARVGGIHFWMPVIPTTKRYLPRTQNLGPRIQNLEPTNARSGGSLSSCFSSRTFGFWCVGQWMIWGWSFWIEDSSLSLRAIFNLQSIRTVCKHPPCLQTLSLHSAPA